MGGITILAFYAPFCLITNQNLKIPEKYIRYETSLFVFTIFYSEIFFAPTNILEVAFGLRAYSPVGSHVNFIL
jgi:hypothetical protein